MLSALDPGQPPRQWRPPPVNVRLDAEGNAVVHQLVPLRQPTVVQGEEESKSDSRQTVVERTSQQAQPSQAANSTLSQASQPQRRCGTGAGVMSFNR